MSEWLSIEIAPKDGTDILLYVQGEGVIQGWYDDGWKYITLDYHGCGCCCGERDVPTHWQPLPPKP